MGVIADVECGQARNLGGVLPDAARLRGDEPLKLAGLGW